MLITLVLFLGSCAELGKVLEETSGISDAQIASGLKEALEQGINKKVNLLTLKDGFYKRATVKIHFPEELKQVESTLRQIGLSQLADKGEEMLNRAAEDAVKEAIPVFKDAIMNMSFSDARNILLGNEHAATDYLRMSTSGTLKNKFSPIISRSFSKVGAEQVWNELINKYNRIPLVKKVNPDLTGYVTDKALDGVFLMVAEEEKEIRNNIKSRKTELLKKVFALQDKSHKYQN
jgi:hypothetical protein